MLVLIVTVEFNFNWLDLEQTVDSPDDDVSEQGQTQQYALLMWVHAHAYDNGRPILELFCQQDVVDEHWHSMHKGISMDTLLDR